MSLGLRVMKLFLWISVLAWGIGLGAKLFDLLVLAGAWGAAPPASFALLPYGRNYPLNPGSFFQPLSALMALGIIGALISGWRASSGVRWRIWLCLLMFVLIWAMTPTIFWPMINQQYAIATGKIVATGTQAIGLTNRWVAWDWFRVGLIAIGFIASVSALSHANGLSSRKR